MWTHCSLTSSLHLQWLFHYNSILYYVANPENVPDAINTERLAHERQEPEFDQALNIAGKPYESEYIWHKGVQFGIGKAVFILSQVISIT